VVVLDFSVFKVYQQGGGNEASMRVMERAGFTKGSESKLIDDREYREFDRKLV